MIDRATRPVWETRLSEGERVSGRVCRGGGIGGADWMVGGCGLAGRGGAVGFSGRTLTDARWGGGAESICFEGRALEGAQKLVCGAGRDESRDTVGSASLQHARRF